jgi:hypothetical protein
VTSDYHFITRWTFEGSRQEIAEILADAESLPRWWPSVYLDVRVLKQNGPDGVGGVFDLWTAGLLPYRLRWRFTTTENAGPDGLALTADGDFRGTGRWTFTQDGRNVHVIYDWRVVAEKPLLKRLTWLLRPLFSANHRWAMRQGKRSLSLELARRRASNAQASARVPSPPGRPSLSFARAKHAPPAHRNFDPRQVGGLEARAWVAYYRREWLSLLRAAIALTRHTFGLTWPATIRGAWLVLRANQFWAPFPDNDPDAARAAMQRFYTLVNDRHGETFDPAVAARLEVRWWQLHREHQHGDRDADDGQLIDALAALYAYVYSVSQDAVRVAAVQRALAMRRSDQWVKDGCSLESPLIAEERAALVRSYAGLLAAVHRA